MFMSDNDAERAMIKAISMMGSTGSVTNGRYHVRTTVDKRILVAINKCIPVSLISNGPSYTYKISLLIVVDRCLAVLSRFPYRRAKPRINVNPEGKKISTPPSLSATLYPDAIMASYDSDSSDGEFEETNVLLGYASKDADEDTISRLGGCPVR